MSFPDSHWLSAGVGSSGSDADSGGLPVAPTWQDSAQSCTRNTFELSRQCLSPVRTGCPPAEVHLKVMSIGWHWPSAGTDVDSLRISAGGQPVDCPEDSTQSCTRNTYELSRQCLSPVRTGRPPAELHLKVMPIPADCQWHLTPLPFLSRRLLTIVLSREAAALG